MTAEADLRSQAREWLVLLNSGRASAADQAAMERWRRTSAEHASALAEAQRLWALLGQVERPAAIVQAMPRRKRHWPLPLASAACLLLGFGTRFAAASLSSVRPVITRVAPSPMKRRMIAPPRLPAAPVTRATLPASFMRKSPSNGPSAPFRHACTYRAASV